jgi:hypothetical protein
MFLRLAQNGFFYRCMVESFYICRNAQPSYVPWFNTLLSLSETAQLYRDPAFVSFYDGAIVCRQAVFEIKILLFQIQRLVF